MSHTNLKTSGLLKKISCSRLIQRDFDKSLVSPDEVFSTRVVIESKPGQTTSVEILGLIPQDYLGKAVKLVDSYYKLTPKRKLFMQEFYVEGKRVVNQAAVHQIY